MTLNRTLARLHHHFQCEFFSLEGMNEISSRSWIVIYLFQEMEWSLSKGEEKKKIFFSHATSFWMKNLYSSCSRSLRSSWCTCLLFVLSFSHSFTFLCVSLLALLCLQEYSLLTIPPPLQKVWFSNRRAKWRREEKLRTQRRSVDHVSGGNGNSTNNTGNGNAGSNGSANVGNTNSVSPPVPTTPRIPLNSGFNSMYASIPQPIATMAENYR